jgi:hypothetical protein
MDPTPWIDIDAALESLIEELETEWARVEHDGARRPRATAKDMVRARAAARDTRTQRPRTAWRPHR